MLAEHSTLLAHLSHVFPVVDPVSGAARVAAAAQVAVAIDGAVSRIILCNAHSIQV